MLSKLYSETLMSVASHLDAMGAISEPPDRAAVNLAEALSACLCTCKERVSGLDPVGHDEERCRYAWTVMLWEGEDVLVGEGTR